MNGCSVMVNTQSSRSSISYMCESSILGYLSFFLCHLVGFTFEEVPLRIEGVGKVIVLIDFGVALVIIFALRFSSLRIRPSHPSPATFIGISVGLVRNPGSTCHVVFRAPTEVLAVQTRRVHLADDRSDETSRGTIFSL